MKAGMRAEGARGFYGGQPLETVPFGKLRAGLRRSPTSGSSLGAWTGRPDFDGLSPGLNGQDYV